MNVRRWDRADVLLALVGFVLALAALAAGSYAWRMHQLMLREQIMLRAEYGQLTGLSKSAGRMAQIEADAKRQFAELAFPYKLDATQAGNEAQQRIRGILSEAKLDIISIQVLPATNTDHGFDRIAITVRAEGTLASLQSAYTSLTRQRPVIALESVTTQTVGAARPGTVPRLGAQLTFFAFRQRNP